MNLELLFCRNILADLRLKIDVGNYSEMELSQIIFLRDLVRDKLRQLDGEEQFIDSCVEY